MSDKFASLEIWANYVPAPCTLAVKQENCATPVTNLVSYLDFSSMFCSSSDTSSRTSRMDLSSTPAFFLLNTLTFCHEQMKLKTCVCFRISKLKINHSIHGRPPQYHRTRCYKPIDARHNSGQCGGKEDAVKNRPKGP